MIMRIVTTLLATGVVLAAKSAGAFCGFYVGGADESELEHGATPAPINNFQGRYAIRHPWTGPITCAEPKRASGAARRAT
jgi:hypothetical protein